MEKRTLIAIALSFLVLGFYPLILEKFYPESSKKSPQSIPSTASVVSKSEAPQKSFTAGPSTGVAEFLPQDDLSFKNRKLKLLFNKKEGAIREVSFPGFNDQATKAPLVLLSLEKGGSAPASLRFLDSGLSSDNAFSNYEINQPSSGMIEAHTAGKAIKVTKSYQFKEDKYAGQLSLNFENTSGAPLEFQYQLFAGSGILPRHSIDSQYIEANFHSTVEGKSVLRHIKETKLGKAIESGASVDWVAIKDRHFSVIFKPTSDVSFSGRTEGLGNHDLSTSLVSPRVVIPSGGSLRHDFLIYLGPNEIEELEPLGLGPLVNFGKLDWIGKLLVGGLELLHKILRNYGLAIIALTILINILLFPLTRVSYMSMKRMQLVQPQINKIREQHKKNPEKLNKEMMELYKKHKVNPFGGCLPMVLQMPVFMALYVALSKSVILINSKLFWIKDLSSPDNIPLPFTLPFLGNQLHVLPIIMLVAMVFQQKFTQIKMEGQDPTMEAQQKMMAVMMPIVFGFIFYSMPSGLVLYWLTNTVLMTLYQLHLKKVTLT